MLKNFGKKKLKYIIDETPNMNAITRKSGNDRILKLNALFKKDNRDTKNMTNSKDELPITTNDQDAQIETTTYNILRSLVIASRASEYNSESESSSNEDSMNIVRMRMPKQLMAINCPKGFGYYLNKESDCTKYTICDDWDLLNVVVNFKKCLNGKLFDMKQLKCLPIAQTICQTKPTETEPEFKPFNLNDPYQRK